MENTLNAMSADNQAGSAGVSAGGAPPSHLLAELKRSQQESDKLRDSLAVREREV